MSKTISSRQYAEEAMHGLAEPTPKKRNKPISTIDLARTWTQAALQSEHIFGDADDPPEIRVQ
jgi:hypothetical protein